MKPKQKNIEWENRKERLRQKVQTVILVRCEYEKASTVDKVVDELFDLLSQTIQQVREEERERVRIYFSLQIMKFNLNNPELTDEQRRELATISLMLEEMERK